MVTKLLLTCAVVIGALLAFRIAGRAADTKMTREEEKARDSVRRKLKGEDFVKCEECGAYTARAEVCVCRAG